VVEGRRPGRSANRAGYSLDRAGCPPLCSGLRSSSGRLVRRAGIPMSRHVSPFALLTLTPLAPPGARPAAPPSPPRTDRYGDPLLPGAFARLGGVRFRASWPASRVEVSPDGRLIAPADRNDVVLWGAATRPVRRRLRGHGRPVQEARFAPGGRPLASGGGDSAVCPWKVATRRRRHADRGRRGDTAGFSLRARRHAG
jgi:hypothetical protein